MKFKGTKISKRTIALLAAAVIMLGTGGVTGAKAAPAVMGDAFDTEINLDSISVALTEDTTQLGEDAELYASLKGEVQPGMKYNDAIGVVNDGAAPEYVRVVVRKYWTKPDGTKDTTLSPSLIVLGLANAGAWTVVNESEETSIYYLHNPLTTEGEGKSAALFSTVMVDKSVATERRIFHNGSEISEAEISTITSGTITYEYKYNGYKFNVEAEAQSVQTHSAKDAIKSVWGVDASSVGINL